MSKDALRQWTAVGILTAWLVCVVLAQPVARGLTAAVGVILTWLFVSRNGKAT